MYLLPRSPRKVKVQFFSCEGFFYFVKVSRKVASIPDDTTFGGFVPGGGGGGRVLLGTELAD